MLIVRSSTSPTKAEPPYRCSGMAVEYLSRFTLFLLQDLQTFEQIHRLRELHVVLRSRFDRRLPLGLAVLIVASLFRGGCFRRFGSRGFALLGVGKVTGQVGLAQIEGGVCGIFHHDVRNDALGLDGAPLGCEIACRGELDGSAVVHWQDGLYRTLAEGLRAHDDGAFMILQCACNDFRGRRRTAIDQHHHRDGFDVGWQVFQVILFRAAFGVILGVGGEPHLGIGGAAFGIDHQFTLGQKSGRDADRTVEQAARVVAQIEYETLESPIVLVVHGFQRLGQVLAGVFLKLRDAGISVARFRHFVLHALHLDDRARQRQYHRLVLALAQHGHHDLGVWFAAHALYGVIQRHAFHRRFIQLDDEVARLEAGPIGRSILDGCDHLDEAVLHSHLDTQPAELALRAGLQFLEALGVKISGMGVEAGQHAVDGLCDQFFVFDRFNVVALDLAEYLGKGAQVIQRQLCLAVLVGDGWVVQAQHYAQHGAQSYQAKLLKSCTHFQFPFVHSPIGQRSFQRVYFPRFTGILQRKLQLYDEEMVTRGKTSKSRERSFRLLPSRRRAWIRHNGWARRLFYR